MKKYFLVSLITYIMILLNSCGVDYSDPQKVLQAYLDDYVKQDYKNAYELLTSKSKEYTTENEFVISMKGADTTWSDKLSYSNLTPLEKNVDKPTYRRYKVDFINVHKNDTSKFRSYFTLLNENDKWKICWVNTIMEQASDKFTDGNYTEPIKLAEKAIEIDPFSAYAYMTIGDCYRVDNSLGSDERIAGMLKNFKYVLSIEPDQPNSYNCLAMYYQAIGNNDLAIEQYKKAINCCMTEKSKAILYRNISFCYNDNELGLALSYSRKATELNPSAAPNWERLGFLQYKLRNYKEANNSFEKALSLPELPSFLRATLYYEIALNLTELNNWSKAKGFVLKALEIEPNNLGLKNLYNQIKSNGY